MTRKEGRGSYKVPLSLCLWKKKEKVFLRPMMSKRPVRNSSCGEGGREA